MSHDLDHAAVLRLGARYLHAYAAQDAVALYHLSDRWSEADLRSAACEVALAAIAAAVGWENVDGFVGRLAGDDPHEPGPHGDS